MNAAKTFEPTVLLGITGGIAAYKACEIVRGLQKQGARVKVVMTEHATEFVGAATFKALTNEPVACPLFDEPGAPIHHISLAQEADVFCIAPCTANVLNKLANGVADDLLTTTALAATAPLIVAPAMNTQMWRAEPTQASLAALQARGIEIIEPECGILACGDEGEGRLASVDTIVEAIMGELGRARDFEGVKMLVTAGPTREPLDPVRFISSPSSGLTGFLIAGEAARRGAEVTLVTGPVTLPDPFDVTVKRVQTAAEMLEAATPVFGEAQAAIFTAAVSDFRPTDPAVSKIKKGRDVAADAPTTLELTPNPDILATLAANKAQTASGKPVYVVGFAAETEDVEAAAQAKLVSKNADLVIGNDVSKPGLGFASDYNQVLFVDAEKTETSEVITKRELARQILDRIAKKL
ncbi:MAG: bifunctional phosphopantothenoylcysteine decarboxylase/phosphopantothenate--cysteine ligase CoaBC [Coriobacteriia bacterium]|nr:bifunctional phosphopantothenoylcysteine decarboxylase/phosphopantothenate--cysteine ligase CoaBC [Coriobacteriia bacterium]